MRVIFYYYYYYLLLESFSHQLTLMILHKSLSDSKSPQVSRTLLSILAHFNNAVVWMVSLRPLISKSSSRIGDSTKNTNYNWYNYHFHVLQFFQFLSISSGTYLSFHFLSLLLLWSVRTANSTILQVVSFSFFFSFFFLLIIIKSSRLAEIEWSVCMSKSQWSLCVSFSRTDAGLCIYLLFLCSNFNFLHSSQLLSLLFYSKRVFQTCIIWWVSIAFLSILANFNNAVV